MPAPAYSTIRLSLVEWVNLTASVRPDGGVDAGRFDGVRRRFIAIILS